MLLCMKMVFSYLNLQILYQNVCGCFFMQAAAPKAGLISYFIITLSPTRTLTNGFFILIRFVIAIESIISITLRL